MSAFDGSEGKFGNSPRSKGEASHSNDKSQPAAKTIVNLVVVRPGCPVSIYDKLLPKFKLGARKGSRVSSQASVTTRSVGTHKRTKYLKHTAASAAKMRKLKNLLSPVSK